MKNGNWLKKNEITTNNAQLSVEKLEDIIKQRPNRKVLFLFYFHAWAYQYGDKKPDKKWRQFFKEIGEPVVILDSNETERSRRQMELYLHKKGYFDAKVSSVTRIKGKNKAIVEYKVNSGKPHKLNKIRFEINDTSLLQTLRRGVIYTKLVPGDNYDEEIIEKERQRMTNVMLNEGYFQFSKEYIYFEADTNLPDKKADLKVVITNASKRVFYAGADSVIKVPHQKFRVNKVFINTRYNYKFPFVSGDTMRVGNFYFLNAEKIIVKPSRLLRSIFLNPGDLYNKSRVEYTYERLSALQVFRSIRIRFEEVEGKDLLNAFIDLSPADKRSLTLEGQGTHRNRSPGISANLSYENRNAFNGAELFELALNGGLEYQNPRSLGINADTVSRFFNTQQAGIQTRISTPSLLLPFQLKRTKTPRYLEPKTELSGAYQWQNRPGYSVYSAQASFNYQWKVGDFHAFRVHPTELNYVWLRKEPSFSVLINESRSALLANSYIDHLISSSKFVYTFSNQTVRRRRNFKYFRTSLESAGNALRGILGTTDIHPGEDDSYELFGVRFAQFMKVDADFRIYNIISKKSDIVYRLYAGVGIPYGNLNALPFEKSFFAGGSNSIRAWNARTLGPGSVSDTLTNIDNIGNFQLEANVEYRFPLYRWIKGALFIDVGNVWTTESAELENGDFQLDRFYKELAVAGGFGTRFDFDFFLIRLDLGVALRDPAYLEGERWLFQTRNATKAIIDNYESKTGIQVRTNFPLHLNLGIGFPF